LNKLISECPTFVNTFRDQIIVLPTGDGMAIGFLRYEVDTIELWISGVIESSGITKLVMSAKGEGGLKAVLKPKTRL
jgi:hypothetical protein